MDKFCVFTVKQVPLWAPTPLIFSNMPNVFKVRYPTTRVILMPLKYLWNDLLYQSSNTYSSYKNHNAYKGLIRISPSGAVTFISDLYPGSISDKELTRRSGILDLLEEGDSVMADRGFVSRKILICSEFD